MKKTTITFLLTLLMSMAGAKAFAYDAMIDGIYYNFSGTNAAVTYNNGYAYTGSVVIPETVKYKGQTYSVTRIDFNAFRYCSGLTSVTIPNSVTFIGAYAFNDCSSLTSVTIPNSVTTISEHAFSFCSGLTSVTIPNSVTSISLFAFYGCSSLTSVTIPNSVTTIGRSAFEGCSSLTSVTIPNSVTTIGNDAFSGCSSLMWVKVSVTDLSAFCNNWVVNGIKNSIGKPVHLIDENGNEIKELVIPEDVTTIANHAFDNCSGLTSVTIPNSVTSIGDFAFYDCYGLLSVVVGNGVTNLPKYVFATGRRINSITIGTGVLTIDSGAFGTGNKHNPPIKTIWLTNTPPNGYTYAQGAVNYVANDLYTGLNNKTVYPFLSSIFEVGKSFRAHL